MEPRLNELQGVISRLEALERQNRRLRRLIAAVSLSAAAIVSLGMAYPEDRALRAERFILLDQRGQEQAHLTAKDGRFSIQVASVHRELVPQKNQPRPQGPRPSPESTGTLVVTDDGALVLMQDDREIARLGRPTVRRAN